MWEVKWLILWSLWAARLVRQPTPAVRVSNGWLRGSTVHSGKFVEYLGIPYASIPYRFQAPGPEPAFDTVFEAIRENIRCEQAFFAFGSVPAGQENCLTLNVYTPLNTSPSQPLPVMVFIHGGGFQEGSSTKMIYGPEYLTRKGVVLVAINYRLTVPGFLCLGIKDAPGNAGMKDQVAALRWVQRNIRVFGGDPDNVTIFGESAGSASVSLHVVSPMSKGLFHKAIQQSGSSLASWAVQYDPMKSAISKAKAAGYSGTSIDAHDLNNFFQSQPNLDIIIKLVKREEGNVMISRLLHTPCIEKKIEGIEPFLTELPHTILSQGRYNKVPMIIGVNAEEGLLFLGMEPNEYIPSIDIKTSLPKDLSFPSEELRNAVGADAKKLYLGDNEILDDNDSKVKLAKYLGEPFFNYPALEEIDLILKTSNQPIFNYMFKYNGWRNIALQMVVRNHHLRQIGATHADELLYMFSQEIVPTLFESRMIDTLTTMWTNFAKYGDPTPSVSELLPVRWPAVKVGDQRSLLIDQQLTTGPMWYNNSTLLFWKDVYEKYRRKTYSWIET